MIDPDRCRSSISVQTDRINVRDGRWLQGMFACMGHPTRYQEYEGLGHIWAGEQGVSGLIWEHWRTHRA